VRVLQDRAPKGLKLSGEFGHLADLWQLRQLRDGRLASGGCDGKIMLHKLDTQEPHGDLFMYFEGRAFLQLDEQMIFTSSHAGDYNLWMWDLQETELGYADMLAALEEAAKKKKKAALLAAQAKPAKKPAKAPAGKKGKGKKEPPKPKEPYIPPPPPRGRINGLRGHEGYIWHCERLLDGRVATGSDDGTIRMWDVVEGAPDGLPLEGHEGPVSCLCAMSDGRLASSSVDGTVRVWHVPPCETRSSVPTLVIQRPTADPPKETDK